MASCLANPLTTEEEVAHGRIGTWPGSLAEDCAREHFPQANFVYLDTIADMAQNLRQKKIEAFSMNRIFVDELIASGQNDVEILGGPLGRTSFSFVFAESEKSRKLCSEFNDFLAESQSNGKLAVWQEKWLFGRGEEENQYFDQWCSKFQSCVNVGQHCESMYQELILMSHLDVMLSMDSANMHLASLTATPVVSVWGATHPLAGFFGFNQPRENAIQVDLDCRPCSIFGNKPCKRGDYACLNNIPPERIVERITSIINN